MATLLLAGCGRGQATPTPAPSSTPPRPTAPADAGGIGCFQRLSVAPATGVPPIGQAEAEARERAARDTPGQRQQGQLAELLEARLVTVLASGQQANGQDALRGRTIWLLAFAFTPQGQPSALPATDGAQLRWRSYALIDAQAGLPLADCTSPLPVSNVPTSPAP